MKKSAFLSLLIVVSLLSITTSCRKDVSPQEGINSYSELQKHFVDPPTDYRTAPLWDWNDQISEEGIAFQMQEFKKAGIGGVFVHPRPGLITEYISEDWHHLFDYTVQKGKELGMDVWIYDENSYPSGFAGGHVPAEMPDSYKHGSGLSIEVLENLNVSASDTFEVVLKKEGDTFVDITKNYKDKLGQTGSYYLFKRTYPEKSPWYGGFSYVDLLYPGVTEKFQEITMRGYEKYNKEDFGHTLKGIFTDEPNLEAAMSRGTVIRWTPDLWEAFENRWGYSLKPHLPSLVYEVGKWKKTRHDYYELLLELFVDRWAKPNYEYCEANNLRWTGHYWEHGWPEPTDGFDESAFYIWHQQPAVDMLGCQLDPDGLGGQFGNTRAIRELRSAANQAGRKRTLSETYGGGGYEMDFKKMKRLADWECVFGVNFVNQHLSYYTLKGVRKFDYPPSFSYHEPWWENYKLMGDYIARVCMATSAGEQINKKLLLQPNTSAWMYFSRVDKNPKINDIKHDFKYFVNQLEEKHFEYDLGSEKVLRDLAEVKNGKLNVGKRAYQLVVLPSEMENIDLHTYDLLREYLEQGGLVLSFRPGIERLDGDLTTKVTDLQAQYSAQWKQASSVDDPLVAKLFKSNGLSIVNSNNNNELFHQRRILDDGQLLFFVNSSENEDAVATIKADGKSVVKIDLFTGEQNLVASRELEKGVEFELKLSPIGSALYFVSNKEESFPDWQGGKQIGDKLKLATISAERRSDNILTIDYLDIKTSKSEKKGVHFMKAVNELFQENGIAFGNPWQHKIQYKQDYLALDSLFDDHSGFEVTYHFQVSDKLKADAAGSIQAVVERPELWTVSINGKLVKPQKDTYWIDKDFPLFPIGQYLQEGENTIKLTAERMSVFAEVMPIYIVGDFSLSPLKQGFEIVNPKGIEVGSWIENGMPYYSQKVAYATNIEAKENDQYLLKLNKWNGAVCNVFVNGTKAGVIAFPPYEIDLSSELKEGKNTIEVEVTGSLKSTFGYFYHPNNKWIHGPHEWNYAPDKQPGLEGMYMLTYGLLEPFDIYRLN